MSNITEEDMAKIMRPGIRVARGKDWYRGDVDKNGPGTVIGNEGLKPGWWHVKWDLDIRLKQVHRMGAEGGYDLVIIDIVKPIPTLGSKLFIGKKFSDLKMICDGKTIDCHKTVLASQSDVFETMFLNMDMTEAKSGEIKIVDFKAETMETFIYYLYNEIIKDVNLINTDLLYVADKYNVSGLMKFCVGHFKSNLSPNNVLDVLLSAHKTNQQDLFRAASKFVYENKGQLAKTSAWKEMKKTNPTMIVNILSTVFDV